MITQRVLAATITVLLTCSVAGSAGAAPSDALRARWVDWPGKCPRWVLYAVGTLPWARTEARWRVPVVVHETAGLGRPATPVTVRFPLPRGANVHSVEVLDQAGFPVPSQSQAEGKECEVIFLAECPPNTWRGYTIYLGQGLSRRVPRPSFIEPTEEGWSVNTGALLARFIEKRITPPWSGPLAYLGTASENFLATDKSALFGSHPYGGVVKGQVVEAGAVRVRLRYAVHNAATGTENENSAFTVTLHRGSPLVEVQGIWPGWYGINVGVALSRGRPTTLTFSDGSAVRRVGLNNRMANTQVPSVPVDEAVGDNWVHLDGDKGSFGLIYNVDEHAIGFADGTTYQGLNVFNRQNANHAAAWLVINGQTQEWAKRLQHPVNLVSLGVQQAKDFSPETVPRLDGDFVNVVWTTDVAGLPDPVEHVRTLKQMGFDGVVFAAEGSHFHWLKNGQEKRWFANAAPFFQAAAEHRMGLVAFLGGGGEAQEWGPCCYGSEPWWQRYWTPTIKALCAYPLSGFLFTDESSLDGQCAVCREKFKAQQGYDLPADWQPGDYKWWREQADLKDPKVFDLLNFKVDGFTAALARGYREIHKHKPDLPVLVNFMHGQMPSDYAFYPGLMVDFDRIADLGYGLSTDLYFEGQELRRYILRYQRGSLRAGHQQRPGGLQWIGNTGQMSTDWIRQQALYQVLYGWKNLAHFHWLYYALRDWEYREAWRDISWQVKSTLGRLAAQGEPVPFVALYWDRDSWWAHLKEGDFSYDKEVLATARLYSLQWEFLFQKHLPGLPLASEDNSYKVVLLPQDRHVSTEVVEALLAHARSGGTLVISGDALEVPALREALGVSGGQKRGTGQVDWADGSFGVEAWRQVELPAGAESEVFATLEAEGQRHPAVIIKKWGQGNLVYFAFGLGAALVNAPLPANSLVKAAVARCQPPPVEAEAGLEPVLFRGDHFHLLGIANNQPQSVQADVRVPRIKGRQRVFDVLDCSEVKCDSGGELKFTAALEAHQVKFYQIVPAGSVQVAPLAPQEVSPGPALKPATRKPQPWQLPAYVPELDAARKEGRIAVGISGAKDLVEALQEGLRQRPELAAVKVSGADLRAELLAHLDALVLCNSGPESPAAITWFSDVREFVEAGGGVLLTHFAIGGGYYPPRLFPEMGRDRGKVVSSTAIPVGDHPIVGGYSGDERYTHMYWDHVIIEPGPAAQPLFQDEAGNVIAVAGPVGKGRVVATGFCFEIDGTPSVSQPAAPTGWPLELLLRILQWAGGR